MLEVGKYRIIFHHSNHRSPCHHIAQATDAPLNKPITSGERPENKTAPHFPLRPFVTDDMMATEKNHFVAPRKAEVFAAVKRHIVGYDAVWSDVGDQHFVRTYCPRPQKAVQRSSEPFLLTYQVSRRNNAVALSI